MRRSIELHFSERPPATMSLAAPCTAGGSRADGVHLPGAPPAALRLTPCAAGVVVEALTAAVRAAGAPLPPGAQRLLRPGERAELQGVALAIPEAAAPDAAGTRVEAAALLEAAAAGEAALVGPHLVVLTGTRAGARLPLGAEQIIGRARGAAIRLFDPLASRRHARLTLSPHGVLLEDLGAKNGVCVNGVRLERRTVPVRSGDEIGIGETILALVLPGADVPPPVPEAPGARPGSAPRRAPGAAPLATAALLALSAAALALSTW